MIVVLPIQLANFLTSTVFECNNLLSTIWRSSRDVMLQPEERKH